MKPVEDALRHAQRVVGGLEKEGWDRSEKGGPVHPVRAVGAQIAGDLPGAHRKAGQDHLTQVELVDQGLEIGSEGVIVVAGGGLARVPEPPSVVGDHPPTGVEQDGQLLLPGVAVQRVAVDQHDRPAGTVVLVVQLYRGPVLLTDGDIWHGNLPGCGSLVSRCAAILGTINRHRASRALGVQPS